MITKYCQHESCGYAAEFAPDTDVYAHVDTICPACKDNTSVTVNIPDFHTTNYIKLWWANRNRNKK